MARYPARRLLLSGLYAIAIYALGASLFRYFSGHWPTLGFSLSGALVFTFVIVPAIVKSSKKPSGVENPGSFH